MPGVVVGAVVAVNLKLELIVAWIVMSDITPLGLHSKMQSSSCQVPLSFLLQSVKVPSISGSLLSCRSLNTVAPLSWGFLTFLLW